EACMAAVGTPVVGTYKEGAVGIPLPDVDLRIVDADDPSRELGSGEIGEIVLEAPQLMEGYWKDAEATKEMLRDGRLYTGDASSPASFGRRTPPCEVASAAGSPCWSRVRRPTAPPPRRTRLSF